MARRVTSPALCQARHRDDRPRHAADGLNLCPGCRSTLDRHLRDLPELHADVLAQLPTGGTSSGPTVSGSRTPPLPYNTRAGDWLGQLRHDLLWLTSLVASSRGISGPPPNPAAQCAWLARHAEWLSAQPDAGAYKDVLSELIGRAYSVIDPGRLPLVLGPCIEQIDGEPCGGTVKVTVRRDGDPTPSVIWCDGCDLDLDTTQWHRYGRRYQRGRMAG
ncbi:hypothetical protein [Nonomuraea gerenzanensis]|uniref:Uncharacterized protein n=1 Tax=Nonomuraea gerenzanensis TaxID=93944 RepID=A0A1M4BKV6_9ACTN|nr:hypothetical protein [Nonomuraea gerenzanensis]UBU10015.1 hypothetical protein LCN96_37440 [Nonomuraea gerenzanensis]SAP16276.1 hypothetical protein BN4615_P10939 [Nonomuraea gerenzanensis]